MHDRLDTFAPVVTVRGLLAAIVWLAALLTSLRYGLTVAVAIMVPLSVLGSDLVVWRRVLRMDEEQPFWCTRARHLIPSAVLVISGTAIVVFAGRRHYGIGQTLIVPVALLACLVAMATGAMASLLTLVQRGYVAPRLQAVSDGSSRAWPRGIWRALPLVAMIGFVAYTFQRVGWPANAGTWLIAAGLVLWCVLSAFKYSRWFWLVLAVMVVLYPADWLSRWPTFRGKVDLCRGRVGRLYGRDYTGMGGEFEIVLAQPGRNTRLIDSYLGPAEPFWVDGRSDLMLLQDDLSEYLSLLPSHEARLNVLRCVTDRDNRLREHQKMLLIGLRAFGFPRGYDSESWWDRHGRLFYSETDPIKALLLVRGWADKMYLLLDYPAGSDLEPENARFLQKYGGTFSCTIRYAAQMEAWCMRCANKRKLEAALADGNNTGLSAVVWWPRRRPLRKSIR